MSKYVKIASVQFNSLAERYSKDSKEIIIDELSSTFKQIKGYNLDLVVFSEGIEAYAQSIDEAESLSSPGDILSAYMDFAAKEKCHIAGSIKLIDGGKVYNSIVYIDPKGDILGVYHKVNLTIGEIEMGLSSGSKGVVIDSEIGRLGGAICFDLNFESLRKDYVDLKPDIITFASMYHGGLMQGVWAYETRSFFVSALPFFGGGIIDPFGRELGVTDCYSEIAMKTVNLDRAMVHLDYNRDRFPDIIRKYKNDIIVDIPPNIGSALIYSNSSKFTAMEIVTEFGLELVDDYFERAIKANSINY